MIRPADESGPLSELVAAIATGVTDSVLAALAPRVEDLVSRATAAVPESADPSPDRLMSSSELAEFIGIDTRTLRRWRGEEWFPAPLDLGGRLRWRKRDVDEALARLRVRRAVGTPG